MKKKLLAGLVTGLYCLSACMMYTSTTTAYAIATGPRYDAPWNGWKEVDDRGMLQFTTAWGWNNGCYDGYTAFLRDDENAFGEKYERICLVARLRYEFGFELKQGQDVRTAAFEIVARYYPEYEKYVHSTDGRLAKSRNFRVRDTDEQRLAENAEAIKRELLAAGLISKFYDVGQLGTVYEPDGHYPASYSARVNVEELQAYIDTAGLDCTVQYYEEEEYDPFGYHLTSPAYYVVPNGEWNYEENFEVAIGIYEALGIYSWFWIDGRASESPSHAFGQNALECPGDLNIDGEVDVSDAVLLARMVAEDDTMPAICDTGYINADVDGDGLLTILDVTALLETIAN